MDQYHYLFDFDSTIVQTEALEELAYIALSKHPKRKDIVEEVGRITTLGMEGKLPFHESLAKRLELVRAHRDHIEALIPVLQQKISPSFLENEAFFKAGEGAVYVISGGFREFIVPVVGRLGIPSSHVLANTFLFDADGFIIGVDMTSPLSKEGGKVDVVRALGLEGTVVMVGDGMSDVQVKEAGLANLFIAYTETIERAPVVARADAVVSSFDELYEYLC